MFNYINLGQYIPGKSLLHRLDPRSKIISLFTLIPLIFLATYPLKLGLLFLLSLLIVLATRIDHQHHLRAIKPFLFIIIITALLQLVFIKGETLIDLYLFSLSYRGVEAAITLTLRLVSIILLTTLFTMTTSPGQITAGIEKMLNPLAKIGLPINELVIIISISLRFIPIFFQEAIRIRKAQICRGAVFNQGTIAKRARGIFSLLVPLFYSCFKRAQDLSQAMESRCYQGRENVNHLHELVLKPIDYYYLIVLFGIVILTII